MPTSSAGGVPQLLHRRVRFKLRQSPYPYTGSPEERGQLTFPGWPSTIGGMETQWNEAPVSGSSEAQFWGCVLYQFLRGSPGRVSPVAHSNDQWINTSLPGFFSSYPPGSLTPASQAPLLKRLPGPKTQVSLSFCFAEKLN